MNDKPIAEIAAARGATRLPELDAAAQRMPFDQFGRYHMLREAIDACRAQLDQPRLSILDVGGFYDAHGTPTLPLAEFVPHDDLTVLDVVACDLPGYVQGDGTALTYEDASFDLVVSADTLEHILQPQRARFWRELLRVARHGVILLAPFDTPGVTAAEEVLFAYIKAELHAEHQQLKEHRDNGLPDLDRWLSFLAQQQIPARVYPTGYLHAWLGMMLIKHLLLHIDPGSEGQALVDSYYNRYFFATERRTPAYRHLIVAQKTSGLLDAVDAALAPTIMPAVDDASNGWDVALGPTMLSLVQRQLAMLHAHRTHDTAMQEHLLAAHQQTIEQLSAQWNAQLAAAHAQTAQVQAEATQMQAESARVQAEAARVQAEEAVQLRDQAAQVQAGADQARHETATVRAELAIAQAQAIQAHDQLARLHSEMDQQAQSHEQLVAQHRDQVRYLRQQVSLLDRMQADQQLALERAYQQAAAAQVQTAQVQAQPHQVAAQYEATLRDLTERAAWLQDQANATRHELEAVKRGRVLRLLNFIARRIGS